MNPVLAAPPLPQGETQNPNLRINSNRAPDPQDPEYILETAVLEITKLWHRFEKWFGMGSSRRKIQPLENLSIKLPLWVNPAPPKQGNRSYRTRHFRRTKDGQSLQGLRGALKKHFREVQDSADGANQSMEEGVGICLSKSKCNNTE